MESNMMEEEDDNANQTDLYYYSPIGENKNK